MIQFTQGDLQFLTGNHHEPCISLYMPAEVKGQETRQNPIRYKNLLDLVEEQLKEAGQDKTEIDAILEQARRLIHDHDFWQTQRPGLAVFFNPDLFQTHRLPIAVEELAVVNDRFHIKPLMPLLYTDNEFYILALQKDRVALFQASQHTVEEIEVPGMPRTLEETQPSNEAEEQTFHLPPAARPGSRGQSAGQGGVSSMHGMGPEDEDREIMRFFREISTALDDFLRDSKAPLILACVPELAPMYRDANKYQHLAEEVIPGSPEGIRMEELRDRGWELLHPLFDSIRHENADRYKMLSGRNDERAVKDLKEVVKAAPFGRVDVLFVDKNAKQWGVFDEKNVEVKLEDEQRPGAQDLLDFAAVQTLMNGGTVFAVDPEQLPDSGPVAAILRY